VAIPSLGFCPGFLFGALPHLAHALMAAGAVDTYKKYRASLPKGRTVSADLERSIWGCTSAQVDAMMLTHVGFGKDLGSSFNEAAECSVPVASIASDLTRKMRLALLWLECLSSGREQPTERLHTKFFPFKTDRERVDNQLTDLKSGPTSWFERSAFDVSKEKTPKLFAQPKKGGRFGDSGATHRGLHFGRDYFDGRVGLRHSR
jgi:hypothetical protein